MAARNPSRCLDSGWERKGDLTYLPSVLEVTAFF